ncbi:MAG: GxxExxY protein [Bacteroidaceae bacterium]|nr:GxxExxY protein [Bacteroidaceae bacterium]MBQ9884007.1 GxxExxY protein [Bacteroidaceae bacterium]
MKTIILHQEESYQIIGAAMEVHKELGCGFTEPIYQEALEQELILRKIPYEREKELHIAYKGKELSKNYRVDFLCFGKIIVELKAVSELNDIYTAQVISYLKASGFKLGLLINFGKTSLEYKRLTYHL